jgi:putative methanogen marker protein 4
MTILEIFESKAKLNEAQIGIGLGQSKEQNLKILEACLEFLEAYKSKILIFGNEIAIDHLKNNNEHIDNYEHIDLITSKEPEQEIINFLSNNMINAVIRGSLSSSKFLKKLKLELNISEVNRLALLETYSGFQFFYGPVGIDECNDIDSKLIFVNKAINEMQSLNIEPKISILSGGRLSDIGRDPKVDKTITIAEEVVDHIKKEHPSLEINHDEILIEKAISNKSNLIIAPDGLSGNLIYRTLVHLGDGKAYGAIYMDLHKIIIDTSRVGKISELKGALLLALALVR